MIDLDNIFFYSCSIIAGNLEIFLAVAMILIWGFWLIIETNVISEKIK